jgi:hypothetical protein
MVDLAANIHNTVCDEGESCKRYRNTGDSHHAFYQERARKLTEKLEPIIGSENIPEVVVIVMDELL